MGYESIEVTPVTPRIGANVAGVTLAKPLSNRQQDEQACGETNLRFPIHGRIDVLVRKSLLALKHVPCQRRYGIGRIKSHVRKRLDLIIELAEALIYAFWKESTGFGKLLFKRNLGLEIAPLTFKKRGELMLPSTKATEAISE